MEGILKIESASKTCDFKYTTKCDVRSVSNGNNYVASWKTRLLGFNELYEFSVSAKSVAYTRKLSPEQVSKSLLDSMDNISATTMIDTCGVNSTDSLVMDYGAEKLVILQSNLRIYLLENGFKILSRAFFKKGSARTAKFSLVITVEINQDSTNNA